MEATQTKNTGNAGKGRVKGSKNKIPADVKAMVQKALANAGGVDYLTQQAHENPKAFLPLVAKLLPNKIEGDAENPVRMIHRIERVIIDPTEHGNGDGDGK